MVKLRIKRKRMRKPKEVEELIADVVAFNKVLKSTARSMSLTILLNNCHPLYREDHRRKLKLMGYDV